MAIWRQKKVQTSPAYDFESFDALSADPFAFEDDREALSSSHSKRKAKIEMAESTQFFRNLRLLLVYGSLAFGVAGVGIVVAKTRPWTFLSTPELVYAYFEVRAVDQSGRPVAGVTVKNAGKKVGITDSFGEWRRYMRVPLGSTVPVTLVKAQGSQVHYATKNFAVPPVKPDKYDLELRASVQLLSANAPQKSAADQPVGIESVPSPVSTTQRLPSIDPSEPNTGPNIAALGSSPARVAVDKSTADDTMVASVTSVHVQKESPVSALPATNAFSSGRAADISEKFVSSHESIWLEAMGSASGPLTTEILPALVNRAKELGVKIDRNSDWRVRLTGLVDKPAHMGADGGGLILISSFDKGQLPAREFLRSYQSDARLTARGILYVLSHQVEKNIAVVRDGSRWLAVLPETSSEFWKLAPGMSFSGLQGQTWQSMPEAIAMPKGRGVYLSVPKNSEGPCIGGKDTCELYLRSFAQVPPVPSWIKIKARIRANLKDQVKIFVSGYEGRVISDNVVEYWGQDHAKVNVTVVQAGKVLHRAQITNDSRVMPTIAWGVGSVSRR
ncbi:MAG: hypothetical protein NTV34_21865 [Proteobacteria bacterium]|nr:hypothetical protein [Pseudomonadota bacterium]